jgi:molybdopterin-guanine dinucleotide biosynthesis protein A
MTEVAFDDEPDAFSNINSPEELAAFENQKPLG